MNPSPFKYIDPKGRMIDLTKCTYSEVKEDDAMNERRITKLQKELRECVEYSIVLKNEIRNRMDNSAKGEGK